MSKNFTSWIETFLASVLTQYQIFLIFAQFRAILMNFQSFAPFRRNFLLNLCFIELPENKNRQQLWFWLILNYVMFLYRRLVQMSSFFNTLLVLLFAVEECQGPRIHIFRTFTRFDTYLQTNVRRILTLGWHGYGSA